uniref:Uncharacterized protein n=1 Tax=Populus trichocarpa TaxID=3694 RepID=A0A2K2ANW5_POPTR
MLSSYSVTLPVPQKPAFLLAVRYCLGHHQLGPSLINPGVHLSHFQSMRLQSLSSTLGRVCGWRVHR